MHDLYVESNNEEETTNGKTNRDTSSNEAEGISDVTTPPVSTISQGI